MVFVKNIENKELRLEPLFDGNSLKGLKVNDKLCEFPQPVATRNDVPVELIFDFLKQFEEEKFFEHLSSYDELFKFINESLNEILAPKIKLMTDELEIEVTASDGFTVPATNFFLKWKDEIIVSELTYVHTRKRINRQKRGKIEISEYDSVEPLLVYSKWFQDKHEKNYMFPKYQQNGLKLEDRPVNLELKSTAATGIPTLMKLETIQAFLARNLTMDPKDIYRELKKEVQKYVNFEWDPRLYDLICCYIIGTYFYDIFYCYPILIFYGDFETGKTRALKTVVWASHRGMLCVDPTPSSMFRTVDAYRPTFAIDEFTKLTEDIQRIARASYKKGEKVPRIEKIKKERFILSLFEIFTPFVLATTEKIQDMLLSRSIQITMRRAKDPNKERRDPEAEDFEEIREKLYLSRLTFAPRVYEASKKIDEMKLEIYGRDYEIWKPILTIAFTIGEKVFNTVLNLARDLIAERREEFHKEEKLLLTVMESIFEEKAGKTLTGETQIEFSATDVLGGLKELILLEEYAGDEKRFYKDWSPQKIGIRLTRMGIRKTRKGKKGSRVYMLTYDEYIKLRFRYNLSDLSDMSVKEGEGVKSQLETDEKEKDLMNFVGSKNEENLGGS